MPRVVIFACLAFAFITFPSGARAAPPPTFVSTSGSDTPTCGATTATACRTIQHAVDIAPQGSDVMPLPGTYFENVKITKSGTGPGAGGLIRIIPQNPKGGDAIVDGSHGPAGSSSLEITGSYVIIVGMYFTGGENGIYVHGTDANHPAIGVRVHYSPIFKNKVHNILLNYTTNFEVAYSSAYASGQESIAINNSPFWYVHNMNIYLSGSPALVPGTVATNSPNGFYTLQIGKENPNSINLVLQNSRATAVFNNPPGSGGTFTYSVTPPSDLPTDAFCNNGP